MSAAKAWLRALERTRDLRRTSAHTLPLAVEAMAARRGAAPALVGEGEALDYAALAARMRQYARWAVEEGLAAGGVVALMAPNRPEYLACWLGLARVGAVTALVNVNLRGGALAHSLAACGARHLIVGPELAEAVRAAAALKVWPLGPRGPADGRSTEPLDGAPAPILADPALMIYTSGTTGLPKAAHVSHQRLMTWSAWFAGMIDAGPHDRLYDCLPLYHSVGGVVGPGAMLVAGGAVVVRRRFSATDFWRDVAEERCTVFQYIGELCRYLLAAPEGAHDRRHGLRLAVGNGLRAEVWRPFQDRFAVPEVLEFYASTEGAFSLYNAEGEPGAVGRIPAYLAHRFPAALVQVDRQSEQPLRDADGRCIPCGADEVGEAVGRLAAEDADAPNRFEGYTDAEAGARKLLRDVFEPGDLWLRTGDLMRRDARGFWWFVDRMGDTFRWKGENVSTSEVARAAAAAPGVRQACVYGVAVPGAEGRAGMAALVVEPGFDPADLRALLAAQLPSYARPVFLRLTPELPATETFKLKTQALAEAGFDPASTTDALFMDDPAAGAYAPLDANLYERLKAGWVRL